MHVFLGYKVGILKSGFLGSGSIVGINSVIVNSRILFSNTSNAGYPCKQIGENLFWIRDMSVAWNEEIEKNREIKIFI